MSSPYQILGERSIDQWKVAELKEELKKRRLTISGLKQDLVKRLDEAVRIERENAQKDFENAHEEVENGLNSDPEPVVAVKSSDPEAVITGINEGNLAGSGKKTGNLDGVSVQVDINSSDAGLDQVNIEEGYVLVGKDSTTIEEKTVVHRTISLINMAVAETVVSDVTLGEQETKSAELEELGSSKPQVNIDDSKPPVESDNSQFQLGSDNANPQLENDSENPQLENDSENPQLENDSENPQLENYSSCPTPHDVIANLFATNNQMNHWLQIVSLLRGNVSGILRALRFLSFKGQILFLRLHPETHFLLLLSAIF